MGPLKKFKILIYRFIDNKMFVFLVICCFITSSYTYCFPEEISNITNTAGCRLIVKESLGCGYLRIDAGLKQLSLKCDDSNKEYILEFVFSFFALQKIEKQTQNASTIIICYASHSK